MFESFIPKQSSADKLFEACLATHAALPNSSMRKPVGYLSKIYKGMGNYHDGVHFDVQLPS